MIGIRGVMPALVAAALLSVLPGAQPPQARFKSKVDAVSVPVSVKDKNRPVTGLGDADFELLDNDVEQAITSTSVETLPTDVTLLLDTSASVKGAALARFKTDIQQIAELLHVNDRVRLVTFGTTVRDVFGLQPGGARLPLEGIEAGGATAFYSALSAALMAYPFNDRPHLIFAFSDGLDSVSFADARQVQSLAGYSGAGLYVMIQQTDTSPKTPMTNSPSLETLEDAAAATGGALYRSVRGAALPPVFRRALDDFRTSYVLTYSPRGVPQSGWHDIVVRAKDKRYTVRARKGYDGG